LIKNFVPQACIWLFFNLLTSSKGAGHYGDYPIRPYQILGLLCFILAIFLFFIGLLVPEVYENLAVPHPDLALVGIDESEAKETDDNDESSEKSSLASTV